MGVWKKLIPKDASERVSRLIDRVRSGRLTDAQEAMAELQVELRRIEVKAAEESLRRTRAISDLEVRREKLQLARIEAKISAQVEDTRQRKEARLQEQQSRLARAFAMKLYKAALANASPEARRVLQRDPDKFFRSLVGHPTREAVQIHRQLREEPTSVDIVDGDAAEDQKKTN